MDEKLKAGFPGTLSRKPPIPPPRCSPFYMTLAYCRQGHTVGTPKFHSKQPHSGLL
jgi:hypothetical protein